MSKPIEGEIVNHSTPVSLTKHDERVVQLLEAAFNNMFNISEACQYAGISRETYYNWLEDDDIFSFRMSVAQQAPNLKAKQNIVAGLQAGDTTLSRWYLERKDPEFKPRAVMEQSEGQIRTEQKLKEFMDDTNDGAYPADTAAADAERAELAASTEPASGDEVAPSPTDIP